MSTATNSPDSSQSGWAAFTEGCRHFTASTIGVWFENFREGGWRGEHYGERSKHFNPLKGYHYDTNEFSLSSLFGWVLSPVICTFPVVYAGVVAGVGKTMLITMAAATCVTTCVAGPLLLASASFLVCSAISPVFGGMPSLVKHCIDKLGKSKQPVVAVKPVALVPQKTIDEQMDALTPEERQRKLDGFRKKYSDDFNALNEKAGDSIATDEPVQALPKISLKVKK